MNIDVTTKLLIKAIEQRDYDAVQTLQTELANEFGHQRGWKITKSPRGLGQLIRRGKYPSYSDSTDVIEDLDHCTWYKNASGELVGLVTQTYGPITCNDPRLRISEPDFPKWHAPDNPESHLHLIEPVATKSLSTTDVSAYHRVIRLMVRGKMWDEIPYKLVAPAYKVATQWRDEEVSDFLAPAMVAKALFDD